MNLDRHGLRKPNTMVEWEQYHTIRRRVLWERRGRYGVYDPTHPDEYKPENHPCLLLYDGVPIGVVRIDIAGDRAILRRVAIREDQQRRGHGRALLALAERFARENGCHELYSSVDAGAVQFYERCGFLNASGVRVGADNVVMRKRLNEESG